MSVAVVFLARGLGGGLASVEDFLASYRKHPPGIPHKLCILAKGWETVPGYNVLKTRASEFEAQIIDLPDDGFDWGAYMRAATVVSEDWICCLNTHSRILSDDWLAILTSAAQDSASGCAGCSGSWGTIAPDLFLWRKAVAERWRTRSTLRATLGGAAQALSALSNLEKIFQFPPFPNPHLRSNAFVLRRSDLIDFQLQSSIPRTKAEAWKLESGRASLTRFLESRGLSPIVVGKSKLQYRSDCWIESNTFRTPDQQNLLVSDNQTRLYDLTSELNRRYLELISWGRTFR